MIDMHSHVRFHSIDCGTLPVEVSISRFQGESGVEEFHLMVRPTKYGSIAAQLEWVYDAYRNALASIGLDADTALMRRFFCSDLPNQASVLDSFPFANPAEPDEFCAVSRVCQPPAGPAKVALWAYHVSDPGGALEKDKDGASLSLKRGELSHIWTTGLTCTDKDTSYHQTKGIFEKYEGCLEPMGLTLADHVIRTWFYVQNVDVHYGGLVAARKQVFEERGLTPDTHFIASTGIEGTSTNIAAKVMMDAYAISGVHSDQIEFLSAPDYLSPTHVYGVTFERGVSVAYQDRKHISISGTASIDSDGRIVHPGDVLQQLDRTLENVEALLKEADAGLGDVCMFIVYVRDPSDMAVTEKVMRERFGSAPMQIVTAPVCRPGWLIEIECQAIIPATSPSLPAF